MAAPAFVKVTMAGIEELRAKAKPDALIGIPLHHTMDRLLRAWEEEAKVEAPVDTGRLRDSITRRMDSASTPRWGEVGSDLPYNVYVQQGRKPGSTPPPASALVGWVLRHGMKASAAFAVARAIGRRGIPPNLYMERAYREAQARINGIWRDIIREVESQWRR